MYHNTCKTNKKNQVQRNLIVVFSLYAKILFILGAVCIVILFATILINKNKKSSYDLNLFAQLIIAISQVLLFIIAFINNSNQTELARISSRNYELSKRVVFEYTQWSGTFQKTGSEDYSIQIIANKHDDVRHLTDFKLELTAIYINIINNIVDDALSLEQPRLHFNKNSVDLFEYNNNEVILSIHNLVGKLRGKYDGKKQMAKLTSNKIFKLYGFLLQMEHWALGDKSHSLCLQVYLYDDFKNNANIHKFFMEALT